MAGAGARVGLITALASRADIPIFPVLGVGGRRAASALAALPGVRVVDHPRAAALLLVVGRPTRALLRPLLVVHDLLPPPRATVWWQAGAGGEDLVAALPSTVIATTGEVAGLRTVFGDLVSGRRASDRPVLPDIEPVPWRGIGPYGQGGSGMTGGVPFGRPLASRSADPDGLELDELPLHVGPLFPPLPPGLELHLEVQGDVLRSASVGENPFTRCPGAPELGPLDTSDFFGALDAPVMVAHLELARARHHLRWAASAVALHGLGAEAHRLRHLAERVSVGDHPSVVALARRLGRCWSLASTMAGIGVLDGGDAPPGPVARAGGRGHDARLDDPAYEGLGFEPVVHEAGDAWDRFLQRLGEAAQALELGGRAGDRVRSPGPPVEGPRGLLEASEVPPSQKLLSLLPDLLEGQEWGDAMTTVISLDIDVEEAAAGAEIQAPVEP